jgi:hypothetical protein
MATTTNYGWTTPNDTDLVKDGAAAIRTLGSSVDTTTKALNPSTTLGDIEYRSSTANTNTRLAVGTTGQVLTVAAGVPSWATPTVGDITAVTAGTGISGGGTTGDVTITNSMATAIDAKGDLIVGTGADTFSRLAAGTNTYVLTADSAEATGLKWAAPSGGSTFAGVRVISNTSAQSIPNATATSITWQGAETYDTDNYHSASTNTDRLTVPSGKAGYYRVWAQLQYQPATTGRRGFGILFNNSTTIANAEISPDSTNYVCASLSGTYYLDVGDYANCILYHERGSSLNSMGNAALSFGMEKIG